jgi:hypothetical protein
VNDIFGASLLTAAMLFSIFFYLFKARKHTKTVQIISQARLHHRYSGSKKHKRRLKPKTQSSRHQDESTTKVIVVDDVAYWIKNNTFYKAPLVNEKIDKDSAEKVDTTNMDKVQLDKMLFIVDKLTEGTSDDSRGSGNA